MGLTNPNSAAMPYPSVSNHIANDPTPKDQAIYVPALQPGFAMGVHKGQWKRSLPSGVNPSDLNILDPDNRSLLHLSHVLVSAGHSMKNTQPCIVSTRDRSKTIVIADSGGYQVASGNLVIRNDQDRLDILRWMEGIADLGMTLDVPTGPLISNPQGYAYKSFTHCLKDTLIHLDFFQKNRVPGKIRLLNVIQGNTVQETDDWYDAVKNYPFEGWAIAGRTRNDFMALCRRVLILANDKKLDGNSWIHVLGTSSMEAAVLLTALQRAINRHINPNVRISYDTSTPFRMVKFGQCYTLPKFAVSEVTMSSAKLPGDPALIGSPLRWPWPSPIGDRMTMADVLVAAQNGSGAVADALGNTLINHHNIGALCWGIAAANRVFDVQCFNHQHSVGKPIGAAAEAIELIIRQGSMQGLQKYSGTFKQVTSLRVLGAGDDERE